MTKKQKYEDAYDGVWFEVARSGNKIACCHCHLVHRVDIRITEPAGRLLPKIEMRMSVLERATAAMRRPLKFTKDDD